jgi:hypothetical protein
MIDDMLGGEQQAASSKLILQDYKKFKHGKEVPQEAEIQYLKQHLLAQALVHHKHVMHMPHDLLDPNPTNTKSTNHKSNVLDLIKQMYPKATTLADIGITKAREAKIRQAIAESYSAPESNPDKEATWKRL